VTWSNYDDVLEQLRGGGLLDRHGGTLLDIEVSTPRPVRVMVEGGDRERRGWYWLHEITLDADAISSAPMGATTARTPASASSSCAATARRARSRRSRKRRSPLATAPTRRA